ncbi:antitoxin [Corynebacterium suedekumii]|uniref:Antitoxin n=1 Tax=Corynebacterium suedekumii TaxID=3049801 RepID=A0ABY8VPY0_9CORY|nr:antitoxin [Corynebacterium suedekumii]WIM71027.1 antitoxin [Corynebacterium suedekumii]
MGIMDNAKGKANEFLNSEKGEQKTDDLMDKGAQHATDRLGEDKAEHIQKARDAADDHIGGVDNETDAPASEDPQADDRP